MKWVGLIVLAILCTVTFPEDCTPPGNDSVKNQVTPMVGKTHYHVFTTTMCKGELHNFTGTYVSTADADKPLVTWRPGKKWKFNCQ